MANGTAAKKHECSCGRSFRHAISLKRHQNVTGCASVEEVEVEVELAPEPKRQESPKAAAPRRKAPAAPAPSPEQDDRTIVITPELVAAWQEQTGFNRRAVPVVDTIAPRPAAPKKEIDWVAVLRTAKDFAAFCSEVKAGTVSGLRTLTTMLAKASFFVAVVIMSGWFLVTTVSASVSTDTDQTAKEEIACQTLVIDFLQNARLNQYQRAHNLLTPDAQRSVSAAKLQMMLNSLPLNQQPSQCTTRLSRDGESAQVVLTRSGLQEVYTLVRSDEGWGLASVSVANS